MSDEYTYHEMQGSPTLTGSPTDGWTAQRRLMCPWVNRHHLMLTLMGPPGALYPYLSCGARVTSVSAEPFQGERVMLDGAMATYEHAVVTVNYSTRAPTTSELVSESLEPNAEFLTQDYTRFRWGTGGPTGAMLLEAEAPGMLQRGLDYVLTYYHLPAVPVGLLSATGCCNAGPVAAKLLGLTFEEETLLFNAPNMQRKIDTTGSEGWQVTYRFSFKPNGWNKFWRAKSKEYESIYLKGEEEPYKQYPPISFAGLVP